MVSNNGLEVIDIKSAGLSSCLLSSCVLSFMHTNFYFSYNHVL